MHFYCLSYNITPPDVDHSLHFLLARRKRHGLAPQPQSNKCEPSSDGYTNTRNPRPGAADGPTTRPLVVCEVPDCDSVFLLDVGEEGSLVVDLEVEDPMLIG